ncbi:MAG: DNA mismatch repair protein MutS [Paenibacillaceae bacterium]
MVKYTPMIEQYLTIKKEVTDSILFFRLGDFYEMFFEDALTASKELEITLTGREGGIEERIPMCGVPHHAADNYVNRLVDKGYKVAICEQVEDPAEAKGVVRREVVRIVTPGTQMDSKSLNHAGNNYMLSVSEHAGRYGLAACDLTTGELSVTSFEQSTELLLDELYVYKPAELIGDDRVLQSMIKLIPSGTKPLRIEEWTSIDQTLFEAQFGSEQTEALDSAAKRAVVLMITYLYATQKRALSHIRTIRVYEPQQYLVLDPFTRRNLELTETVRDRSRAGSLLWLLDKTVTSIGARQLKRWIEKPLMNKQEIEQRLEAVEFLSTDLMSREDIRSGLKEVYDLERLVGRISYGNANARDLIALQLSLQQVPGIIAICRNSASSTLQSLVMGIDECSDVRSWIETAIDENAPVSVREGGMIKSGFDDYLDQLREASKNGKQWMAELERTEREHTGIKSLKMGFNKVFGYYIEVTKANIALLPEGRYERKQTLSNAERYVTPELKEKEALILEAEDKMVGLEYELFIELRDRIAGHIARLQKLADVLSRIDSLQSLAEVSAVRQYQRPILTDGYDLIIEEGRHAVVEAVLKDERFVSNGTLLREEQGSMLLITGPNMAGKSTYMRQVAIICIMAQIGCFVPAAYAEVPIIDRIFTRIGAADDLIGGQSTFMVEMMDIRVMTEKATQKSLVIIDELGRGTSTNEGMAIAQAVIEFLHDQIGCKTLVSTHFHELAHLEVSLPSLSNGRMAVKESGNDVSFLRKLVEGAADTSYGIYCAQIAGLPHSIIQRSYSLLQSLEVQYAAAVETAAAKPSPQVVQLSLFDPVSYDIQPIVDAISKADLMNMTPLQAMQLIDELKQLVKK